MKLSQVLSSIVILSVLLARHNVEARNFGVFVDGAYGRGQTEMNELVDRRVDGAKAVFDARYPTGSSSRASTKAQLKAQLQAITCSPGDSITIAMVGHGRGGGNSSKEYFYFPLAIFKSGHVKLHVVAGVRLVVRDHRTMSRIENQPRAAIDIPAARWDRIDNEAIYV